MFDVEERSEIPPLLYGVGKAGEDGKWKMVNGKC
jgi:hypothetical protein